MTNTGISIREFARLDGCSDTLVRNKIKQGYLTAYGDGTLDPALVGTDWRKRTYVKRSKVKSAPEPDVEEEVDANVDKDRLQAKAAAKALVSSSGYEMLSEADAKARKENFAARLRELEYDIKSKKVVLISDVMDIVEAALGRVKSKLENIPSSCAMRLAAISEAEVIRKFLQEEIAIVLGELILELR